MTEDDDLKDFELFKGKFMAEHQNKFSREEFSHAEPIIYWAFVESRRTLREKIKADPSIGKLVVEEGGKDV